MIRIRALLLLLPFLLWTGCESTSKPAPAPKDVSLVFRAEKLAAIDRAINDAIASNRCPGGVFWLERNGTAYSQFYGRRAVEPSVEAMTTDTVFDAASLTKVLATTPAILKLIELGRIELDAPYARYIPEFAANGKEAITIRQILTHTSGLRPGLGAGTWRGSDKALQLACAETPTQPPDTKFVYSDINFILLGKLVERVSGQSLNEFCAAAFYRPLRMRDTTYLPLGRIPLARIAPTERQSDGICLRGIVHDPTARRMGGVAGHAGVFTSAGDIARFCRMMLNGGELDGVRVFKPETVALMTSVQSPPGLPKRGLGWDIDSPYAGPRGNVFPVGGYGHSGWTGTSFWVDPGSHTFVIFLSNRNHPTEDGNVIALRRVLGTLAAESLIGVDFGAAR